QNLSVKIYSVTHAHRYHTIRCEATAYDLAFKEYFAKRHAKGLAKVRTLGLLGQLDKDGLRMARAV
ncbi:MAG: hypothetical protein JSR33_10110, partial [Proteobacteria bacterium]|nr:hypothetical protein [Pseudomonadota bacterium]